MKVDWKGVYPAVSTQFRQDQSIDLDATQTVIDNQIKDGVNGIICLGTVGENCALYPIRKKSVRCYKLPKKWLMVVFLLLLVRQSQLPQRLSITCKTRTKLVSTGVW